MEESKVSQRPLRPRIDTGNVRKIRSPYQLQYLEYEKRQNEKVRVKLPSLRSSARGGSTAKHMNNK